MITEANTQALLRLITNNENATDFDLANWAHPCGTYGCLVGNDLIACGRNPVEFSLMTYRDAGQHYGLSAVVSAFLFAPFEGNRGRWGFLLQQCNYQDGFVGSALVNSCWHERNRSDLQAALNRIRKAVYYILHKRELMYDDDSGRVRETARRAEGDHHVLRSVKRRVDEECSGVHEPAYLAAINASVPEVEFPQTRTV